MTDAERIRGFADEIRKHAEEFGPGEDNFYWDVERLAKGLLAALDAPLGPFSNEEDAIECQQNVAKLIAKAMGLEEG